jgi:hypothetical protein
MNFLKDLGANHLMACRQVLKSIGFKGSLIMDLDIPRRGPGPSYGR